MLAYVFPGQGSQTKGMGNDLFDQFPELVQKADTILGYSIKTLCLDDPEQKINFTQYTQPALYVVNALTYYKKDKKPDFVAGHSLGEYNALLAAEVFDFETGLKLVQKRGELMSHAKEGGMAAVIGLTLETIKNILVENNLSQVVVANHNSYTQVVISGGKAEVDQTQSLFEAAGAKLFMPLKVSGAFHSPYMQAAQTEFEAFLREFTFNAPKIPVIANLTAKPYEASALKETLAKQISHTVQWVESIDHLLAQGAMEFEEIGPGSVLTGLIKRIRNKQ